MSNPRHAALPILATLGAGVLFGLGLGISQMTHPEKIKDFLDLAALSSGGWDPSLVFVMGGALLVAMIFYRIGRPPRRPFLSGTFAHSWRRQIDARLVGGSAIFGLGWGLVGLCPGPAIADLSLIPAEVVTFVGAMATGSWVVGLVLAARAEARVRTVPAE